LPALPTQWPAGSVHGLRARGGYELSITWKDGRLSSAQIMNSLGGSCTIRYGPKTVHLALAAREVVNLNGDLATVLRN